MTAAIDDYVQLSTGLDSPYRHAAAISTSDTVDLSNVTRGIYVGVGGNINLITANGETVLFKGALVGTILRVQASRVKATSTTATDLVALW
jgi:hypothetical protein